MYAPRTPGLDTLNLEKSGNTCHCLKRINTHEKVTMGSGNLSKRKNFLVVGSKRRGKENRAEQSKS
jgi:hypothetical protein